MNKYDEIISSCEGLIYTIINNYFRGYNIEDLYQVGVIGVIKAYDKYKENKSTKFSTYAYKWIYGEIYAYINSSKLLKVNSENIRLYKKIIEANNYLCQTLMRTPSTKEIALYIDELTEYCNEKGWPKFRAKQIYEWLHKYNKYIHFAESYDNFIDIIENIKIENNKSKYEFQNKEYIDIIVKGLEK